MDVTSLVVLPVRARERNGRRARGRCLGLAAALFGLWAQPASASSLPTGFSEYQISYYLDLPTAMAMLPDGRMFVTEQVSGRVRLIVHGYMGKVDPVLTLPDVNTYGLERGLLGITVDPLWPLRPYIYLHYTSSATGTIHVCRYTCSGDLAGADGDSITCDPASKYEILTDIPDQDLSHNGGTLRFGPDACLYVSIGEDEAYCAAQDTSTFRGKILRLNVFGLPPGPGGPPPKSMLVPPSGNPFPGPNEDSRLMWAIGLRNPFRFHIDPVTGFLYIADVGTARYEEIDCATKGGMNFGWPYREGPVEGPWGGCPWPPPDAVYDEPIAYYDRTSFPLGAAIISAGVYRSPCPGCEASFPPEYEGDYFYFDYYMGFLRRIKLTSGTWSPAVAVGQPDPDDWATGFTSAVDAAVGPDGALYVLRQYDDTWGYYTGSVRVIRPSFAVGVADPGIGHARAQLGPAHPNPTTGGASVSLHLSRSAPVGARVLDAQGRVVRVLVDSAMLPAGSRTLWWDGADQNGRPARSGLYFMEVRVEGERWVRRVARTR